jgi:hypothetical protein
MAKVNVQVSGGVDNLIARLIQADSDFTDSIKAAIVSDVLDKDGTSIGNWNCSRNDDRSATVNAEGYPPFNVMIDTQTGVVKFTDYVGAKDLTVVFDVMLVNLNRK